MTAPARQPGLVASATVNFSVGEFESVVSKMTTQNLKVFLAKLPRSEATTEEKEGQAPHLKMKHSAVVYVVTYGGGLVAGDSVSLQFVVDGGACGVVTTQASTKVFKTQALAR